MLVAGSLGAYSSAQPGFNKGVWPAAAHEHLLCSMHVCQSQLSYPCILFTLAADTHFHPVSLPGCGLRSSRPPARSGRASMLVTGATSTRRGTLNASIKQVRVWILPLHCAHHCAKAAAPATRMQEWMWSLVLRRENHLPPSTCIGAQHIQAHRHENTTGETCTIYDPEKNCVAECLFLSLNVYAMAWKSLNMCCTLHDIEVNISLQ